MGLLPKHLSRCHNSRNGDLVHDCLKVISMNGSSVSGYNPGHNIIDNIEVEIGGQVIDKHYGHWMEAHAELTEPSQGATTNTTNSGAEFEVGSNNSDNLSSFQVASGAGGIYLDSESFINLYVPLRLV